MITHTCEQYSDEYWGLKLGRISASKMSKLITSTGKLSTQWKDTLYKTVAENETGYYEEAYRNGAMERGLELESDALESFEFISGLNVETVGIVEAKHTPIICSPDAIGQKIGVEIKCPSAGVHLKYRYENKLPTDYKPQVFTSLYVCDEVDRWYFYSYHPDMKRFITYVDKSDEEYKLYVEAIEKYTPQFLDFMTDVMETCLI